MVDRSRAQSVLLQAREILADRMSELILEAEGQFLEDAAGDSYMDEIGTVFEKVGGRLSQVNVMLANFSVSAAQAPEAEESNEHPESNAPAGSSNPALATFQAFAMQIMNGDLESASSSLEGLFELDAITARTCSSTFQNCLAGDGETMQRLMDLRIQIAEGRDNAALLFLNECFGLTGLEGIGVLQHLKTRFSRAA